MTEEGHVHNAIVAHTRVRKRPFITASYAKALLVHDNVSVRIEPNAMAALNRMAEAYITQICNNALVMATRQWDMDTSGGRNVSPVVLTEDHVIEASDFPRDV